MKIPASGWKRFLIGMLLFTGIATAPAIVSARLDVSRVHDSLIASIPASFPPYYLLDSEGKPRGFAIDVMNQLAARAGITVSYRIASSWMDANAAIRNGTADLIPNIGITADRKLWLDFTNPVETFALRIFVRKQTVGVKSLADLHGRKVGAVRTNVGVSLLKTRTDIQLRIFPDLHEAIFELIAGRVDALVYPQPVMAYQLREAGLDDRVQAVGKPLIEIKRAVGVCKGLADVRERINTAIGEFVGSKEYHQIYLKWFGRPRPYWTPVRVASFMGGFLVLALSIMAGWRLHTVASLNRRLQQEISERNRLEESLERHLAELEKQVGQRTQELRESENNLRNVVLNNADGIVVLDKDGRIHLANPAAEQLLQRNEEKLLSRVFAREAAGEGVSVIEIPTGDRDSRVIEIRRAAVSWQGQDVWIASLRDITVHSRMEKMLWQAKEKAEMANRAKSAFLANMSHELRTPLNSIIGFSQVLQEEYFGELNSKQRECLQDILVSGKHLLSLINEVLALSQAEAGVIHLHLAQVRIQDLIEDSVSNFRRQAADKNITIHRRFVVAPPDLEITADAGLIKRVLANLISNAIKFTPPQGTIEVGVSKDRWRDELAMVDRPLPVGGTSGEEEWVRVWVADTGAGVSSEERWKIFEPFYQSETMLINKPHGTGLGLALCKQYVELHGGRIWMDCQRCDHGSFFAFQLPVRGPAGETRESTD